MSAILTDMNKEHWISVRLDDRLDFEMLKVLIDMSWDLTMKKQKCNREGEL